MLDKAGYMTQVEGVRMTDSEDSILFGNNDDLYPTQRQYDEHESLAQVPPSSAEPLFPATSAANGHSWTESLSRSNGGNAGSYWADLRDESTADHLDAQNDHAGHNGGHNGRHNGFHKELYSGHAGDDGTTDYLGAIDYTRREGSDLVALPAAETTPAQPVTNSFPMTHPALSSLEDGMASEPASYSPPSSPKPVLNEREEQLNRHYAVLTDLMQHGVWPQAVEKLRAMRAEYPEVKELETLLDEAVLKAELMVQWTDKVKGRRLTVGQEWLIRRSLPFFLLLALFVSGAIFYQAFVAPSRMVVAMERANQALVEEAIGLLQVGQIDQAIDLYNLVLSRNPNFSAAQQGLAEANRLSGLAVTYDLAIRVANKGNLNRSLLMLQSIKAQSPSFRDIDARITRVSSLLAAESEYILAERAFAQRRWTEAVTHYQNTQVLAADYQAARVLLQLGQAYFMASQRLMAQWPTAQFGTEQIRDFLRRAQELHGQDETIDAFLVNLEDFMKGERSLQNDNISQAVKTWSELYAEQPAFLGGYLAEQLYRAYLVLAAEVRTADPDYARELYTLAAAMPVHDSSEARTQLQNLGAKAPAAQPTPTPRPTVAYVAPVAAAPPPPTATPEPTPTPTNASQGWIAFRTTRAGFEEIYVMRGDGSEQQPAPDDVRGRIDSLYQEERRGPDGRMVFVQSANGRSDANIYIASSDGLNRSVVTDYTGDEYDPVWSPSGDRIVFVANHTGNDELWIMRADGSEQRQLTINTWEWDKHPTWSPDSSQIAFFSNRSGKRQVWVMSPDGSGQRNLSSNNYDDWDPVWIK